MTQAAHALEIACDIGKQKLYHLNWPLKKSINRSVSQLVNQSINQMQLYKFSYWLGRKM